MTKLGDIPFRLYVGVYLILYKRFVSRVPNLVMVGAQRDQV